MIVKPHGPQNAVRPFHPGMGEDDPALRIARALEHIAVALSAIDHNVEAILAQMTKMAR